MDGWSTKRGGGGGEERVVLIVDRKAESRGWLIVEGGERRERLRQEEAGRGQSERGL